MKLRIIAFAILSLLMIYGCGNNEKASFDSTPIEKSIATSSNEPQKIDVERKLIKEGFVEFETEDINATRKQIIESAKKYRAYISSDKEYKSIDEIRNTIIIRVPANNFDALLNEATKDVTKFDRKNIDIKDVTEQFIDIQARLNTKKELEKRYLELLKKAKNVPEILEVEKQLGQLRSDIEAVEGRLKYLNNKVSLSTLNITFYQKIPHETKFGKAFKKGLVNGWHNLIWFFVFLVNIWPFLLIGIVLIIGIRRWKKRKRKINA